jgi:putative redox protein
MMAVRMHEHYQGNKRVQLVHELSGVEIISDAPLDNGGRGEGFSPTDMVSSAYAACILTIMANVAEREQIDFTTATAVITKEMTEQPRQIKAITIEITLPKSLTINQKKKLEHTAQTCPVALSLNPTIERSISFKYE